MIACGHCKHKSRAPKWKCGCDCRWPSCPTHAIIGFSCQPMARKEAKHGLVLKRAAYDMDEEGYPIPTRTQRKFRRRGPSRISFASISPSGSDPPCPPPSLGFPGGSPGPLLVQDIRAKRQRERQDSNPPKRVRKALHEPPYSNRPASTRGSSNLGAPCNALPPSRADSGRPPDPGESSFSTRSVARGIRLGPILAARFPHLQQNRSM